MKPQGKGEAGGKVILMGEHAVVYGEPALALPFNDVRVRITVEPASTYTLTSDVYHGNLTDDEGLTRPMMVLLRRLDERLQTGPLKVVVDGDIPIHAGLGSSAAVAAALTSACYNLMDEPLDDEDHIEWVQVAEKIAHGNPSGVDATTVVKRRPVLFVKGEGVMTMTLSLPGYFVVGFSGIPGQTKRAVAKIAGVYANEATKSHLRALGQLTTMAVSFDHASDPERFGELMSEAHKRLQALGVTSKALDNMVHGAMASGALGAKMTGGGLGGSVIAYADTKEAADAVRAYFTRSTDEPAWVMRSGVTT